MNNKKEFIQRLLDELSHTPMTRQQMAMFLDVTVIFVARYITQLRASKQIYIERYERTPNGKPKAFYAAGDKPDAEELPPIPQRILQKNHREARRKEAELVHGNTKPKPFKPKMDIAASWLKNPC
jgi:predicted ArsR family transcriptional regulator